jgi:general L-amino acid transport system permease protein
LKLTLNLFELWHHKRTRQWLIQTAVVMAILTLLGWLCYNTWFNLKSRGIQSGFDFLTESAGFDIGEHFLLAFDSSDNYGWAFLAGLLNTLKVSILGLIISSLLGLLVGTGRTSPQTLIRWCSRAYVECLRNVPLLLQLLMWYVLLIEYLPSSETPYSWFNAIYLSQEGLSMPMLMWQPHESNAFFDVQLIWSWPTMDRFGIHSDMNLSPEFIALTFALSLYTSAFVAEIVRAGIESVPKGQIEAAKSVGLDNFQISRFVVLPQAAQLIRPPLTNQYLNLIKNSSLAVAIGYPDVVSIANTALNQTGRALECISILMTLYLMLSLMVAWGMGRFKDASSLAIEKDQEAQDRAQQRPHRTGTSHA